MDDGTAEPATFDSSFRRTLNSSVLFESVRFDAPRLETFESRIFFSAIVVGERQRRVGRELDLPGFQRGRGRRLVGDHAPTRSCPIREILAPVIRVSFGDDELPPVHTATN